MEMPKPGSEHEVLARLAGKYGFNMEMSKDGDNWQPLMERVYEPV